MHALRARGAECIFVVATVMALAGCRSEPVNPFATMRNSDPAGTSGVDSVAVDAAPDAPSSALGLESDGWYEQIWPPFSVRDESFRRWHHAAADTLIASRDSNRADLAGLLVETNPVVAANAAIVLAYWGTGQPTPRLAAAIRDEKLNAKLRSAAAEALGNVRDPAADVAIRELLDGFLPLDEQAGRAASPIFPDMQADLLRALARSPRPGDEAWFTAALRSPAWNVRYEGIVAWQRAGGPLPMLAIDRRSDPDPRVRAAALRTIAAHGNEHTIEYLQQGLGDRSIEVRMAAIESLGELQSDEAVALLNRLRSDQSDLTRAAAVLALGASGVRDEIEAVARDKSHHVRLAAAQLLASAGQAGRQVAVETIATAEQLARDASADVQRQAIEAMADWPLEQAGPLLLVAIAEGGYTARKAAAAQLARRWPPAADFPVDAMAERRDLAIEELKTLWTQQYGAINEAVVAARSEVQQLVNLSLEQAQEIRRILQLLDDADLPRQTREEAIRLLTAAGPPLLLLFERELAAGTVLPALIYEEVLPAVHASFVTIERLRASDVLARRAAASELAKRVATGAGLPPLAARRIAELVRGETDPAVWRAVLEAVADDASESAHEMAYVAIGHASSEVRRCACNYLAAHGSPRHAPVLVPALGDTDITVVLAAIRALGAVRSLDDPAALVRLLNLPERNVRFEAALSLARLGRPEGIAALERLALDADLEIRIRTATAMGQVGDRSLVPALLAMLGDKPDVARVAMLSLAQIAGTDPAAPVDGVPLSHDEKVRRWQRWYREQQDLELARP